MGLFTGMGDVRPAAPRNPRIPLGNHVLDLDNIRRSVTKRKEEYALLTFVVAETDSKECKKGDQLALYFQEDQWGYAKRELKACLAALMGQEDVDDSDVEAALSAANPLSGSRVKVRGYQPRDKSTGEPVVKKDGQPAINYEFRAIEV